MAGEPGRRHATTILLAALLVAASTATAGLISPATPPLPETSPASTMTGFQEAMAWSQAHKDTLIAPLVPGAGLQGWHHQAIEAYHAGHAWATYQLGTGDRATLTTALATMLETEDLPSTPMNVDRLPEAYVAPVATLLTAQHVTALQAQALPDPNIAPHAFTRMLGQDSAWLLGTLDAVLPALRTAAATTTIDESFPLDAAGMVIIGSHNDDTYHPHELAPDVVWNGTLLLIEPDGDDTYHMNVATQSTVTLPPAPGEERCIPDVHRELDFISCKRATTHPSLAIELGGDDDYLGQVASARAAATTAILYDETGNDTYGTQDLDYAVAIATGAASFLLDRGGDDVYETRRFGFAYSFLGIAIMSDWQGDDTYDAYTGIGGGHTHAKAAWPGTLAVLRDWQGNDTYQADGAAYASVLGDGNALLIDDAGKDSYHTQAHELTFGDRYNGGGGILEHPVNHAPAYFLDGNGHDTYTWDREVTHLNPGPTRNNLTDVRDAPGDQPWGIFVDCQTPDEARFPCEQEQPAVLEGMIETA